MYEPQKDPTAGGALASAILNMISAHKAVTTDGAQLDILRSTQKDLANLLNEYVINRISADP